MAYITNPVYLGVGSVDAVDRAAMFRKETWLRENFKAAYNALTQMSPVQVASIASRASAMASSLPATQQAQVRAAYTAIKGTDPRVASGLGAGEGALAGLANVATLIASLTTAGLAVATFIDTRKATKEQKESQDRQAALIAKQAAEEIAARKQVLADSKRAADAAEAGVTLDAEGNPIQKKASPLSTIATLAAAAGGALLITK